MQHGALPSRRLSRILGWAILVLLVGALAPAAPASSAAARATTAPGGAGPRAADASGANSAVLIAPPAAPGAVQQPATVRIGVIGLVADAGIFIAEERGYFREQNLTIVSDQFDTAATMMPLLASGQMDVATGGIIAALYNAIARGLGIVLTADKGSQPPGYGANQIMLRKDLADTVRSARDFRGRPIGMDIPGTVNRYWWDLYLPQDGLSLNDLDLQVLTFPDMVGALANGRIDAAIAPEPFPTIAEGRDIATRFLTTDVIAPYSQPGVLFYSRDFVDRQTDVGNRFMVAYLKGVRDYNHALARRGAELDAMIQILIKHTSLKDPAIYQRMTPFGLDPNGALYRDSIMDMQAYFNRTGEVPEQVPWERIVDTRFIDYAVQTLGPYQP
jgi:NitT/TauT family transport system substrate-binding protein